MIHDLVIIGAGGFGRETLDVVRAINDVTPTWRFLGFIDDGLSPANRARVDDLFVPYLGGLSVIPSGVPVAVAVGDPAARSAIVGSLAGRHPFPALIHPMTILGSELRHGEGLIVLGGVSVGTNVSLGNHVHLNAAAVIGHDVRLGDRVSINPNATISGDVSVGDDTLIGAGAVILQGLHIGTASTVGAAACVTRAVPDGAVVKGIPAR